jgi:[acyl-carrier-protein] S-malonyltransferase
MNNQAVVFAGQGAQFVGMGRDLAEAYPECRRLFAQADEALGYGLSALCFQGPLEELTKSNHCQPAIFLASLACYAAVRRVAPGFEPAVLAGLSLGEWTALQVGGALSFEDALRVLAARGRFMQEACAEREGGMVSVIGLPLEKLREICGEAGVEMANLNSPEQTVLSGEKQRILKAGELAAAAGAKRTVMLNVAGAFHSSLMASAAQRLAEMLKTVPIQAPAKPVLSNVTGAPHGNPDQIREAMVRQVTSPVQWLACIQWCGAQGIRRYLECGPGKVLSGLIKRIDKQAGLADVQDVASLQNAAEALRS